MGKLVKTSPKKIKAAEDTAKALDLKRAGLTLRQIASAIGRSVGWVHGAIAKYCAEHPADNLEQYRREETERQLAIIASHWPTRANHHSAKVIQDSAKILIALKGASAPQGIDVNANVTVTESAHEQLLSNLAGLAAKLGKREGDPEAGSG